MRTGDKNQLIPLTGYEIAVLSCLRIAPEGLSVSDLRKYLRLFGKIEPSQASLSAGLRRMELRAWITPGVKTFGDGVRGPRQVSTWMIINPGRDVLKAHDEWYQKLTRIAA